jgi:hypothetical protein
MTHQEIIERTVQAINLLPNERAEEISDFADFITKKYEEQLITAGIQQFVVESNTFSFLKEEDDLYTLGDLKVLYNDQR